ncbi:hypothetical protein [Paracidovorax cattleyae]|uniref:Uncharacterized protein n=1 Tax=Paracidovorax cattleyae TaxID=80868 RepID=A0A1H0NY94_9BURK|nr:hypothetical protein [Paracidovorax cattleyae]AVS75166.1 hypothetical protein C8240_15290 [Paracidovorax cattleyae]MBF9267135.1 hypothetical protein [Paracidovorax cattleyae]SDO97631.1 hypothetical protein SAMN04489708_105206 [Paracidovorax cattleyae]
MPKPHRKPPGDEPEVTQETDVPVDRTDPVGEEMMKEVRNDRLQQPAGGGESPAPPQPRR